MIPTIRSMDSIPRSGTILPTSSRQEWFSAEERFRREANAHAYSQHGTPSNWFRYLTLGYFVYDDCCKFDALWMKYSDDPIICHRMVLYNFFYHIDRNFDTPANLQVWAMDVSQPYLQRHAPQYLAINTIIQTWNDYIHGDYDVLDIDRTQWTTVGGSKKRQSMDNPSQKRMHDNRTLNTSSTHQLPNNQNVAPSPGSTSPPDNQSHDETSTVGKQSVLQPDLNVPVNDGTYRLTFRWHPKGDFSLYNEHSTLWLKEAHGMMQDIFSDEDCFFYRWESTDLQMSTTISKLAW
ncbi:hypothetical protein MHU86_15156 [Fragilaria crotonensis]|nr:hypothetical protein MHU86_15156 [Fragilaria crotonensis]